MGYRLTSADGTTGVANEEIVSKMRVFTTLDGSDDSINPFRPKSLYLECVADTSIYVNGENATALKEDLSTGMFYINLDKYDIIIKTLKLGAIGTAWKATFLF